MMPLFLNIYSFMNWAKACFWDTAVWNCVDVSLEPRFLGGGFSID